MCTGVDIIFKLYHLNSCFSTGNRRRLHEKVKQEQDVENPEKISNSAENPKPPKKKKFNRK
jgi:hypothetical protein